MDLVLLEKGEGELEVQDEVDQLHLVRVHEQYVFVEGDRGDSYIFSLKQVKILGENVFVVLDF